MDSIIRTIDYSQESYPKQQWLWNFEIFCFNFYDSLRKQ